MDLNIPRGVKVVGERFKNLKAQRESGLSVKALQYAVSREFRSTPRTSTRSKSNIIQSISLVTQGISWIRYFTL